MTVLSSWKLAAAWDVYIFSLATTSLTMKNELELDVCVCVCVLENA
jgi:hypothetical protein